MKTIRFLIYAAIAIITIGCSQTTTHKNFIAGDPLDQWHEGPAKASILNFVKNVTDETHSGFIPAPDRIAVFDMDGTILLEKPYPINFDVIISLLEHQITGNPALAQKQPYKAIQEQDWAYFDTLSYDGDDGIYNILLTSTEGYTEDQYKDFILEYFKTFTDKRFNKPYPQLVYVPMVQLIQYLEEKQFEVYIVSGSDPQFTRTFCEDAAHIPSQNVIGTTILTEWVETDTGSYFIRLREFVKPINDEGGKAVNILNKIGKVPVIAVGNSPGDYPMLQFSKNSRNNLQMIVNHDDSVREYVYDYEKMKKMCLENGWMEISMKNDFKTIFDK